MNEREIEKIIQQGESQTIEFKEEEIKPSKLAETIVAMANAEGGKILIGVNDKNRETVGVKNREKVIDLIYNACSKDCCDPPINIETPQFINTKGDKTVAAVSVPKSWHELHSTRGRFLQRVGTQNRPMRSGLIERRYYQLGKVDFGILPVKGASIDDFDTRLLEVYQRGIERYTGSKITISTKELLQNRKCLVKYNGQLVASNAGMLLFGKETYQHLPQVQIICARFEGVDMQSFIDRKYYEGNVTEIIDEATNFIKRNIRLGRRIVQEERTDYEEYPYEAYREVIVNAVLHRDYSILGANVRVFIFDDRIEVYTPGGLLPGIAIEKMYMKKSQHQTRNTILFNEILYLNRYVEKVGSGIQRMIEATEKEGLEIPVFEDLGSDFLVTLIGPGEEFMKKEKRINQ